MRLRSRRRRGANAIEFALVSTVMFPLLMGIMEYGWVFFSQIMLDAACREGARVGSRTPADAEVAPGQAGVNAAQDFWDVRHVPGDPLFVPSAGNSAGYVLYVMRGTLEYGSLTGNLVPVPEQLVATIVMVVE